MELKEIQYFITIVNEKSFTRASKKLFVSQPALSLCLQRLEKELNAQLLFRDKSNFVLTPAGKLLFENGSRIIEMFHYMTQNIYDVVNFSDGVIRIGFSQFYGRYYSPELFRNFYTRYPGIHIELIEDFSNHLEDYILKDELDLCIIPLPVLSDSIAYVPLFQEKIYFAAPKEIYISIQNNSSNLPTIDLSLMKDQSYILLKKYQKIRRISDDICRDFGFSPNILFESQDMNTINNFIALNMGVGFVSDIIEQTSSVKDKVNYFRIDSDKAVRSFVIAYKKGTNLSSASKRFIDLAQECFSEI
ncbi:MAG: LysR family transcriptional regulator [Dysgonamonadaceae bacterium]|nr:LysR family transcriptional regulator [Dysgonamonadaceae bacterium]